MPIKRSSDAAFKVSPRLIEPLGLEQLPDPALAVLELIKNSWDADATRVFVEIDQRGGESSITVRDNGFGMSRKDFREKWLVIGASHKRGAKGGKRPLIGEKGLGRLASYALGSRLTIKSAATGSDGFRASVDWNKFFQSSSVEDYKIHLRPTQVPRGTTVEISALRNPWSERHTEFLSSYAQFLVAVPGERFRISLKVDGVNNPLIDPVEAISAIAEAELDMRVEHDGTPVIVRCVVSGEDYSGVQFRNFKAAYKDSRLAGSTLSLKFYLRDKIARQLKQVLQFSDVNDVLERYQGIRIYRDGINVPPYGLNGNDWAALEKQRTSTGGPTMVPGNSQLIGELRVPPSKHLSITAGRSGFSDQEAVAGLAAYVRWSVKELGTARRAEILGIHAGVVPSRVDGEGNKTEVNQEKLARRALADLARDEIVTRAPELRQRIERVRTDIESVFDKNEGTLRLYAQLASTGIAATSFAHELRTDFDVVSAAVKEIVKKRLIKDDELKSLLVGSWARIKNFVALFRLLPVKTRRNKSEMRQKDLQASVNGVFKLVPEDTVHVGSAVQDIRIVVVPAELDSILLNLVSNSVKAIAESRQNKNGKIRVEISGRGADAVISVFDNGCGVPEQLKAVMFEPLEGRFSEGTGMGLAIVSYIAQRYKGSVVVADAPAGGYVTQIRVTLKGVLG